MNKNLHNADHPEEDEELLPKRECLDTDDGTATLEVGSETLTEETTSESALSRPDLAELAHEVREDQEEQAERELELNTLAVQTLENQHFQAAVDALREGSELQEDQKRSIVLIFHAQLVASPPGEGESFEDWNSSKNKDQRLLMMITAAQSQNNNLLTLIDKSWDGIREEARQSERFANFAEGDTSAASNEEEKDLFGSLMQSAKDHPIAAGAIALAGAYSLYWVGSKIMGRQTNTGFLGYSALAATGIFVMGKSLQSDGLKDWLEGKLGVDVDDWRIGRALQRLGNLDYVGAVGELFSDNTEMRTEEAEELAENLQGFVESENGLTDIVYGREAFQPAREETLMYLQMKSPPRIHPGRNWEQLNSDERLLVIKQSLLNPRRVDEEAIVSQPYGDLEEEQREQIDEFDRIFDEFGKIEEQMESQNDGDIFDYFKNEVSGLGDFNDLAGRLSDDQRRQVGGALKAQMGAYWRPFSDLKNTWQGWKAGESEGLPPESAFQMVQMEQVFSQYVSGLREHQDERQSAALWQIPAILLGGAIAAGGGFSVVASAAGAGATLACSAVKIGASAASTAVGALGVYTIPIVIGIAAAARGGYELYSESERREDNIERDISGWQVMAIERSREGNHDYVRQLYQMCYLFRADQDANAAGAILNYFDGGPINRNEGNLRKIRKNILAAAIDARLSSPPFINSETRQNYQTKANEFLENNRARFDDYAPSSAGEAMIWVDECLRYATFRGLNPDLTEERAQEMVSQGVRTQGEIMHGEELLERITNSNDPIDQMYSEFVKENPEAIAGGVGFFRLIQGCAGSEHYGEIRPDDFDTAQSYLYEMYGNRGEDFVVAYAAARGHTIDRRLAVEERVNDRTLAGIEEHAGEPKNETEQYSTVFDAEVGRISVLQELFQQYEGQPAMQAVIGMGHSAVTTLNICQIEGQSHCFENYDTADEYWQIYDWAADYGNEQRLGKTYGAALRGFSTVMPEFLERIKDMPDDLKLRHANNYYRLFTASFNSNQHVYDGDPAAVVRGLMEISLATSEELLLPSELPQDEAVDSATLGICAQSANFYLNRAASIHGISGINLTSAAEKLDENTIRVSNNDQSQEINYDVQRNVYTLGEMSFINTPNGLTNAIMAASSINNLIQEYRSTYFEDEARENNQYFYYSNFDIQDNNSATGIGRTVDHLNYGNGIVLRESDVVGADEGVFPQGVLFTFVQEPGEFVETLNAAMVGVVAAAESSRARQEETARSVFTDVTGSETVGDAAATTNRLGRRALSEVGYSESEQQEDARHTIRRVDAVADGTWVAPWSKDADWGRYEDWNPFR